VRVDPVVSGNPAFVCVCRAMTAKSDGLREFETLDLPRESFAQPGIGFLDLITVVDSLMEHTVVITYTVTDDGQAECCATIEKTGGQASQTTVAQAGVVFVLSDILEVQAKPPECFGGFIFDPETKEGISKQTPHQELQRHVGDQPVLVPFCCLARDGPALH
jgi:hypothetical protein